MILYFVCDLELCVTVESFVTLRLSWTTSDCGERNWRRRWTTIAGISLTSSPRQTMADTAPTLVYADCSLSTLEI